MPSSKVNIKAQIRDLYEKVTNLERRVEAFKPFLTPPPSPSPSAYEKSMPGPLQEAPKSHAHADAVYEEIIDPPQGPALYEEPREVEELNLSPYVNEHDNNIEALNVPDGNGVGVNDRGIKLEIGGAKRRTNKRRTTKRRTTKRRTTKRRTTKRRVNRN